MVNHFLVRSEATLKKNFVSCPAGGRICGQSGGGKIFFFTLFFFFFKKILTKKIFFGQNEKKKVPILQ